MTQESHKLEPKFAFGELSIQLLTQSLEHSPQVTDMVRFTLGIYQDVVNEYNHKEIQVKSEHSVHQLHKRGGGISQSK